MKKLRVLAVLAIVLVLAITCLTTNAQAASTVASGSCGDNVTWTLDSDGTLTISGKGAMYNYSDYSDQPWYGYTDSIQTVEIKSGVTSIGEKAFYSCDSLTNITIPNSVTSIGSDAFCYCDGLTSVTIPNSVTSIGSAAFRSCEALISVTIPNSMTSIGEYVFCDCTGLTSVTIPDSVTSIGNGALRNLKSLKKITIPNSVTSIGQVAFEYCSSLTSITLPNNLTRIRWATFRECDSLTSITIPSSVTRIDDDAFCYCDSLTSIMIPNNVTSIDANPFNGCTSLTTISVGSANSYYTSVDGVLYTKDKKEIVVYPCGRSGSYQIPNGVTSIGEKAFCSCESLANITIPNSVTSIGEHAFSGCNGITSVTIPGSVTSIDYGAFSGCDNLTGVTIPNSVTSIGKMAFRDCDSLTSIVIPSSVISLGERAFEYCRGLTGITLSNGLTSIGVSAFSGCKSLTSATIPNSVTSIGDYAFGYCDSLTYVVFEGDKPELSEAPFANVTATAYYPAGNSTWAGIEDQDVGGTITWKESKPLALKSEPKTGYAKMGETVKTSVKAEGDGLTYQWYIKNASASKYTKSSVTKSTYAATMSDKVKGRRVYCVITDLYGNSVQTKTVLLREAASIVTEPKTTYAKSGKTAKVSVEASGDELTYQWYIKNAGAEKYSKSSITSDTYSVKMSDKVHGRRVYCVVKDKYGKTVQSKTVLLRMAATITTQPKSVKVEKGETAKVTVKATGDGLKYQWYVKNKGADSFTKSSIKKSTYSVEMSSKVDGRKVYCVVTDKYGKTAKSDTATLTMKVSFEITSQPKSVRVDKGETAKVTVKATGKDLTYTWYYMNAGQTKFSKSSVTKSTYSVEMSNKVSGRQVYCVVKDASDKKLQTKTVTLNITGGPEITTQPKNKTVAAGKSVTLSVVAKGKGLTYEWYFLDPKDSDPKDSEYRLSAAISDDPSTYSFLMLEKMDGRKVFCVITDSSGRKTTSKTITIKLA